MIQVFLDESGTHGPAPVTVVGAVWASVDEWKKWTFDWDVQKQPIKVFHSSECNNFSGEFRGWNADDRNALVKNLLSVIRRHPIRARVAGFNRQELMKEMSARPDILEWMGDPYFTAFQFALRSIWNALEKQGHRHIEFVHEVNQYKDIALEYFDIERKKRSTRFARMTFGKKPEFTPLQCADLIAYEGYRQLQTSDVRKPLSAIFEGTDRLRFVKYDQPGTVDMAKRLIRTFDELRAADVAQPEN